MPANIGRAAKERVSPDWEVIRSIPPWILTVPLSSFHKQTIRRALAARGKPKEYLIRTLFDDRKDKNGREHKGKASRTAAMLTKALCKEVTLSEKKIEGLLDRRYSGPPSVSIMLSETIEVRRIVYWAEIMAPEHDDKSDTQIRSYSKSCSDHAKNELLRFIKRECGSYWERGGDSATC